MSCLVHTVVMTIEVCTPVLYARVTRHTDLVHGHVFGFLEGQVQAQFLDNLASLMCDVIICLYLAGFIRSDDHHVVRGETLCRLASASASFLWGAKTY